MQMTRVFSFKEAVPPNGLRIDRKSKWGNPFVLGRDGDRTAVIFKHERWLADQHELLRSLDELRDRDLICWCHPLPCHGDLLCRLGNATRDERVAWWRRVSAMPKCY
jgi:hypothetical protein